MAFARISTHQTARSGIEPTWHVTDPGVWTTADGHDARRHQPSPGHRRLEYRRCLVVFETRRRLEMKSIEHASVLNGALAAGAQVLPEGRMTVERLPFTVRVVRSEEALDKAVAIRQAAYARHVPAFAEKLKTPEANDYDQGS